MKTTESLTGTDSDHWSWGGDRRETILEDLGAKKNERDRQEKRKMARGLAYGWEDLQTAAKSGGIRADGRGNCKQNGGG